MTWKSIAQRKVRVHARDGGGCPSARQKFGPCHDGRRNFLRRTTHRTQHMDRHDLELLGLPGLLGGGLDDRRDAPVRLAEVGDVTTPPSMNRDCCAMGAAHDARHDHCAPPLADVSHH